MTSTAITPVPAIPGLGARPAGTTPGCARCRHPHALHSNGKTGCKAWACTGGPSVSCTKCGGSTLNVATGEACPVCEGTGSVSLPCPGFVEAVDQAAA